MAGEQSREMGVWHLQGHDVQQVGLVAPGLTVRRLLSARTASRPVPSTTSPPTPRGLGEQGARGLNLTRTCTAQAGQARPSGRRGGSTPATAHPTEAGAPQPALPR